MDAHNKNLFEGRSMEALRVAFIRARFEERNVFGREDIVEWLHGQQRTGELDAKGWHELLGKIPANRLFRTRIERTDPETRVDADAVRALCTFVLLHHVEPERIAAEDDFNMAVAISPDGTEIIHAKHVIVVYRDVRKQEWIAFCIRETVRRARTGGGATRWRAKRSTYEYRYDEACLHSPLFRSKSMWLRD